MLAVAKSTLYLGLAAACLGFGGKAAARQGDAPAVEVEADWDLIQDDDDVTAVLSFEPLPVFIVRCVDHRFDVLITGLQAVPGAAGLRIVDLQWNDAPVTTPPWSALTPTVAVSQTPEWMARTFRRGGALRMTARASVETPGQQYRLDIPPSPSAINQALTACGLPLEDDHDAEMASAVDRDLLDGLEWQRRPAPEFPQQAVLAGLREGSVRLSCHVQATGRMADCRVDYESSPGLGFGASALRSMRSGRLTEASATPWPDGKLRMVSFMIRFRYN